MQHRHLTDDADDWLHGYVREKQDGYPSADVLNELLAVAPHDGGIVYRGMNFHSEAAWKAFAARTENFTVFESDGVTSWTQLEETAANFCLTRPTYELNHDLMHDERYRSRTNDFMIGYAGVVLRIELEPGQGVDVGKTRHALGEAEVMLPPGRYMIHLERHEIPFMRAINEENLAEHLERLQPSNMTKRDEAKFRHIISRFTNYTSEQRQHLFRLATSVNGVVDLGAARSESNCRFKSGGGKIAVFHLWCDIPSEYVEHYDKFIPKDQAKVDRLLDRWVAELDAKFDQVVEGFDWDNHMFEVLMSLPLAQAIQDGRVKPRFAQTINDGIGRFLRQQTSHAETIRINDLSAKEKITAIATHGKKIAHVMNQRVKTPPRQIADRPLASSGERTQRRTPRP